MNEQIINEKTLKRTTMINSSLNYLMQPRHVDTYTSDGINKDNVKTYFTTQAESPTFAHCA